MFDGHPAPLTIQVSLLCLFASIIVPWIALSFNQKVAKWCGVVFTVLGTLLFAVSEAQMPGGMTRVDLLFIGPLLLVCWAHAIALWFGVRVRLWFALPVLLLAGLGLWLLGPFFGVVIF